jgi:predicted nucleotidyltransferase
MSTKVETKETVSRLIEENKDKVRKFGVERLGLFGSFVRGDQNENSDIDILVEFSSDKKNYDNFINLVFFLEEIFQRRVELVTPESISPYLKPYIMDEVEYVEIAH